MEPAFYDGDRVISFNYGVIKAGSVVVFKLGSKNLIKRIKKLESNSITACADNKNLARREYRVDRKDIIGRVVLRYSKPRLKV